MALGRILICVSLLLSGAAHAQPSRDLLLLFAGDGAELWTPAAGLSGDFHWYDPSDTSTLTVISNEVDEIADKSGNGYHLSADGATNRPGESGTAINGLNTLDCDGSDDELHRTASGIEIEDGFIMVAVFRKVTALGSDEMLMTMDIASLNSDAGIWWDTNSLQFRANDSFPSTSKANANVDTGVQVVSGHRNGNRVYSSFNGDNLTQSDFTVSDASAVTDWRLCNGPIGGGNHPFDGDVGEILWIDSGLSGDAIVAQVRQAEGYLAHKWGITLDASHPYAGAAPTL